MEKDAAPETTVSFRISKETLGQFGLIAKASHRTVSDALRLLIDDTIRKDSLPEAK